MPKRQTAGSGGVRKHGRNNEKCEKYQREHRREKNKLRRILQSSGVKAANKYAKLHNLSTRFIK